MADTLARRGVDRGGRNIAYDRGALRETQGRNTESSEEAVMTPQRPIRHDVARELAISLRALVNEFESIRGVDAYRSDNWRRARLALFEAERS